MTEIAASDPYALFEADDGTVVNVPAGSSLLVVASQPHGSDFVFRSLGEGVRDGDRSLVITADEPTGTVTERIQDAAGRDAVDDALRVIDCQTDRPGEPSEDVLGQNVDTPRNLTDIGIGFKDALDEFESTDADRIRFGLLSLSVILSYVDRETGYRFCQTLTRGLEGANAVGLFVLTADAHDEQTIKTFRRAFDGVVEIRTEDGVSARLSGIDGVAGDWHTIG